MLAGKSMCVENVRRGGVAVYVRSCTDLELSVFEDLCPDTVVFTIKGTRLLFIAPYITPDNSRYKTVGIFDRLAIIINHFKAYKIYVIGDLNARCGTPNIANTR